MRSPEAVATEVSTRMGTGPGGGIHDAAVAAIVADRAERATLHVVVIEWSEDSADPTVIASWRREALDPLTVAAIVDMWSAMVDDAHTSEVTEFRADHPMTVDEAEALDAEAAAEWLAALHECDGCPWITAQEVVVSA
jgi:hypothetical protein